MNEIEIDMLAVIRTYFVADCEAYLAGAKDFGALMTACNIFMADAHGMALDAKSEEVLHAAMLCVYDEFRMRGAPNARIRLRAALAALG